MGMIAPDRKAAPYFFFVFQGNTYPHTYTSPHSHLPSLTPPLSAFLPCLWFQLMFSALDIADLVTHGSFSVFLFSYSGYCHSVLTHCYDSTAHQGPGDPQVYPAPLSSRAKNSTASPCLLCWNISQAPQTQHVPSALTIHVHPSSCHHCHPLLLCLRQTHSSSSIGEPTI